MKLNIEQENSLVEKYLNGESSTKLMKEYNLSYLSAVTNIVKKHGFKSRRVGTPNIITYNRNKFLNPYPESVYWFGFLLADGCLLKHKTTYYLQVVLQYSDINILERFKEYFEIENTNITFPYCVSGANKDKKYKQCKLTFSIDDEIVEYLKIFGIVQRKSLINYIPDVCIFTEEIVIKNFLRGYFDGDGGVTIYQKKNGHGDKTTMAITISWLGTHSFLEWIKTQLFYYLNMQIKAKIISLKNISSFSWGHHNFTKLFYEWIYSNNEEFCMYRKKDKIYNFLCEKELMYT